MHSKPCQNFNIELLLSLVQFFGQHTSRKNNFVHYALHYYSFIDGIHELLLINLIFFISGKQDFNL